MNIAKVSQAIVLIAFGILVGTAVTAKIDSAYILPTPPTHVDAGLVLDQEVVVTQLSYSESSKGKEDEITVRPEGDYPCSDGPPQISCIGEQISLASGSGAYLGQKYRVTVRKVN